MNDLTEKFVEFLKTHLQSCIRIIPNRAAIRSRIDSVTSFQVILLTFHYEQTKMKKECINREKLVQNLSNGNEIRYEYLRNKSNVNLKWKVGGSTINVEKNQRLIDKHRIEEQPTNLTVDSNSIDNFFNKTMRTRISSLVDRKIRKT